MSDDPYQMPPDDQTPPLVVGLDTTPWSLLQQVDGLALEQRHPYFQTAVDLVVSYTAPGPERDTLRKRLLEVFKGVRADTLDGALAVATYRREHPEPFAQIEALLDGTPDAAALKAALLPFGALLNTLQKKQKATREDVALRSGLREWLEPWLFKICGPNVHPREVIAQAIDEADLLQHAPPPPDPAALERRRAELRVAAAPVLDHETPLEVIGEELARVGWGGDLKIVKTLYLAAMSRLLPKGRRGGTLPCHCQLNGHPGSGKNHALDCVLALHPPSTYVEYDAGSPRVIIYDSTSYRHRIICYAEADSLPGASSNKDESDAAASMIRTLLTKGEAEYKVVGKDPDTGEFDVQVIRKEGPTTLFTTTVSRVKGEQLDSRLYALDIPDDPAQQRAALHAQAKMELDGDIPEAGPAFLALQEWLQLQAPIMVVVPYVGPLFKLLGQSRTDPRLLRDSKRLLTLIKCSAILHLAHRERDAKGRLVAGLQDYQTIADLIVDMYEVTVTGVTPGMRRVVEAVAQAGKPISQTDVADCLKISTSTVGKHVKRALTGGWLVNDEYRPGHPDRLKVGEELPHPCGLPSVAQLRTQGAGSGAIGLTPSHFPPRNQEVRTVSPHQAETAETPGGLTVLTNGKIRNNRVGVSLLVPKTGVCPPPAPGEVPCPVCHAPSPGPLPLMTTLHFPDAPRSVVRVPFGPRPAPWVAWRPTS